MVVLALFFLCWVVQKLSWGQVPDGDPTWEKAISPDGNLYPARNAHASCVFKGKIWIVGGRCNSYTNYNLLTSYKRADVWYSEDADTWKTDGSLTGDYFAQNADVLQPKEIAPFYERFGHTLNAIDTNGDGEEDVMVLLGGFSPSPSNDQWVTADGNNWAFAGNAPWSPRAWHASTVFEGRLWIMGGTPLNNEVWVLDNITMVERPAPLTRAMYNNYTYALKWRQLPDAPWSPRVGMAVATQMFFNPNAGESLQHSRERIVLIGGYGGFLESSPAPNRYDGFRCRRDSWSTYDGVHWELLNTTNLFKARAWAVLGVYRGADPRLDILATPEDPRPPKLYLFGGGYVGFTQNSQKIVNSVDAYYDAFYSEDGANWVQINYEEGGQSGSSVPVYSSELWSQTTVNSETTYLGLWGATMVSFNVSTKKQHPGRFILMGGDYDGSGDFSSTTYKSLPALFCNTKGVTCNGLGICSSSGRCVCNSGGASFQCLEDTAPDVVSSAPPLLSLSLSVLCLTLSVALSLLRI